MTMTAPELDAWVADAERRTSAEVVFVLASRADDWLDARLGVGLAAALLTLAALVFGPWWIVDLALPGWVTLAAGLGAGVGRRLVPLLPVGLRHARVRRAAEAAFVTEEVHATGERLGVLVYVSALEGVVEIIPDVGVRARLPAGTLEAIVVRPDHLRADLDAFVTLLADALPATDTRNLLPDAPRVHR